jgi:4-hydroxy-4-methyl-2-oxoglutarate aldolase
MTTFKMQRLAEVDQGMISDCMIRLGLDGWMDGLHAVGEPKPFVGRARTMLIGPRRGVETLPKSKYAAVASLDPGDVLVLGGFPTNENQMGDNVARFAQMHGVAAIVCDAPVRDYAGISALAMPVFSSGRSARMPVTTETVALDVPIVCGGAQVRVGDVIVGSNDGVLVLPKSRIDEVLYQLDDLEEIERTLQAAILAGRSLREIEELAGRKKKLRAPVVA